MDEISKPQARAEDLPTASAMPPQFDAGLLETSEFKEAVANAVAHALKGIPVAGANQDLQGLFSEMALAIGDMSRQGSGRSKPVAPEILAKREAADKRYRGVLAEMEKHLKAARAAKDEEAIEHWTPKYRVTAKIYFCERFIEPFRKLADKSVVPQEIVWTGPLCDGLFPLNEIAERIYDPYRESIGATARLQKIRLGGGVVIPDNRPFWMTPGGLIVQGDGPEKLIVGAPTPKDDLPMGNDDPNAPEIHILGTVAAPARRTNASLRP